MSDPVSSNISLIGYVRNEFLELVRQLHLLGSCMAISNPETWWKVLKNSNSSTLDSRSFIVFNRISGVSGKKSGTHRVPLHLDEPMA